MTDGIDARKAINAVVDAPSAVIAVMSIDALADDDEAAHSYEDEFHQRVLRLIAEGVDRPQALAEIALRTQEIEFARWCA